MGGWSISLHSNMKGICGGDLRIREDDFVIPGLKFSQQSAMKTKRDKGAEVFTGRNGP